jgi:hypothetical protein
MLQSLTNRFGGDQPVQTVLDPQPGTCCVALTSNGQPADPTVDVAS